MMLDKLTKESFEPHLNSNFELTLDSEIITLELTDVEALQSSARRWGKKKAVAVKRDPFSLIFFGPHDPAFRQDMHPMKHDQMGEIGSIFFVAIGEDEDGRYYQAIFS
ncbi:MAG: hypothetical protein DRR19_29250 [Candidatus Parabeggiatoa sp. nov. 1]|nr:MAG: hypothetical protein DRR19_29250 [Gammaproteobacteria bacterium]